MTRNGTGRAATGVDAVAKATSSGSRSKAEDNPGGRRPVTPGAIGVAGRAADSSHLTTWRAARERGELPGAGTERGPRGGSSARAPCTCRFTSRIDGGV